MNRKSKGNHLQGEGAKCMERGTIFGGGGDHKQRKVLPSYGERIYLQGEGTFSQFSFLTMNKMLQGCSNGNPVK